MEEVTTMINRDQIDRLVTQDVLASICNRRTSYGDIVYAPGFLKILDNKVFIEITNQDRCSKSAQMKLVEAEQQLSELFSLLPVKEQQENEIINQAKADHDSALADLKEKERLLSVTEAQLELSKSTMIPPPSTDDPIFSTAQHPSKPKRSTNPQKPKNQNLNAILFILCVDIAVLLSSWSILRQSLGTDQIIHRSIIVLVISVMSFALENNYIQSRQTIHRILSAITLLMLVSSVFSGVLIDIFVSSAESSIVDDFSLTEIIQVDRTTNLLQKYVDHPGILELLIAFICFLIGKFCFKPRIESVEASQDYQFYDDPVLLWENKVKQCILMVEKAQKIAMCAEEKIAYIENEKYKLIQKLYSEIEKCEKNIEEIRTNSDKCNKNFRRLLNLLLSKLLEYEELWRMRMAIQFALSAESFVFVMPSENDIFKYYNIINNDK